MVVACFPCRQELAIQAIQEGREGQGDLGEEGAEGLDQTTTTELTSLTQGDLATATTLSSEIGQQSILQEALNQTIDQQLTLTSQVLMLCIQ